MTRQRANLTPSHSNAAGRYVVGLETGRTSPAADQHRPASTRLVRCTNSALGNDGPFAKSW
jgi:hypothetical protein